MVILQSKLRELVIDIYFTMTFVRLNNNRYIYCYCILKYDDNHKFDLYVSYISSIIIFLTNFESVISCYFHHNVTEQSKNFIKFNF